MRDQADYFSCFGCGGVFANVVGPTHRYMESTPGCWAAYGEVLARQYADASYAVAGQMTVDAYAVQHPGRESPQSIQSVALHLMSLCLQFEHERTPAEATQAVARVANDKLRFRWLLPPAERGELNVGDAYRARNAEEHVRIVRDWASSAWRAWSKYHSTVREWLAAAE